MLVAWEEMSARKVLSPEVIYLRASYMLKFTDLHMDGGSRLPTVSPYNLSEISRGNKQLLKLLSLEFLKMLGSFLRTNKK